jgi:hypothetical protein
MAGADGINGGMDLMGLKVDDQDIRMVHGKYFFFGSRRSVRLEIKPAHGGFLSLSLLN